MTKIKKKLEKSAVKILAKKRPAHYTEAYIINPAHPVTVNVIGCGGTGSQVLTSLARMNKALLGLGHTGFFVRAIDPDKVTEANMGRQLFSPADIGLHKSVALVGRINRFFGTDWDGIPERYKSKTSISSANITITCVDSGAARKEIKEVLKNAAGKRKVHDWEQDYLEPYERPYYWMDYGNMKDRGQVVIGTLQAIKQPAKSDYDLLSVIPCVDDLHPDILKDIKGEDQGPSCSLAEALQKQDLFINTNLANMGLAILWKMFRELHIKYHGCYVNLNSMAVNAIPV